MHNIPSHLLAALYLNKYASLLQPGEKRLLLLCIIFLHIVQQPSTSWLSTWIKEDPPLLFFLYSRCNENGEDESDDEFCWLSETYNSCLTMLREPAVIACLCLLVLQIQVSPKFAIILYHDRPASWKDICYKLCRKQVISRTVFGKKLGLEVCLGGKYWQSSHNYCAAALPGPAGLRRDSGWH